MSNPTTMPIADPMVKPATMRAKLTAASTMIEPDSSIRTPSRSVA
ncbi:Uncharacterised protein [Bordetella pertussis]|nr:Uncharacterised protein [Bordetella pertussis]